MSISTPADKGPGGERIADTDWRRNFGLLWTGTTLTQFGTVITLIAYTLLALAMTGSPVFAGWVVFAGMAPGAILSLPAGVLADRLDRRTVLVTSQLVRAGSVVVLPLTLATGHAVPALLLVVAFVDGTCTTIYSVTEVALLPQLVPAESLTVAISRNESRLHLALLAGRPLGGLLFGLSRVLPFAFNAAAALVAAALAWQLRTSGSDTAPKAGGTSFTALWSDLREGLTWVRRHRVVRLTIAHDTLQNFLMQALSLTVIAHAVERGYAGWFIGLILAASGVGGLLGSYFAASTVRGRSLRQVLIATGWVWAAFATLLAVSDRPLVVLIAFATYGVNASHTNVAVTNYQTRAVPRELLGRVMSVDRCFSMGVVPLGGLAGGYLIPAIGAHRSLVLMATIGGLWAVALTVSMRRIPASAEPVTG